MALSDLILQHIPTMGLWFVKTKTTSMDISQLRVLIESAISYYHEFGFFDALLPELNDYILNGYFWEHQVYIDDFDPLYFENCETETILIDEIQVFNKHKDESLVRALRQTERMAMKHGKSIFVFVHEKSSIFADEFVLKRLINT